MVWEQVAKAETKRRKRATSAGNTPLDEIRNAVVVGRATAMFHCVVANPQFHPSPRHCPFLLHLLTEQCESVRMKA